MAAWGIAAAKSKLSEVIHEAETNGPQTLLRSGRQVAVVISIKEWQHLQGEKKALVPQPSMAEFFMRSPLRNSGLKSERLKWKQREINL